MFPVEPEVAELVRRAAASLGGDGAHVTDADVDLGCSYEQICDVLDRYLSLCLASADAVLAQAGVQLADERRDAVDPAVVRHIETGRGILAVDGKLDDLVRTRVLDGFARAFEHCDVLVSPVVGVPGVSNELAAAGEPLAVAGRTVEPLLGWVLTAPVNFCGLPAASVPAGRLGDLPVGMQVIAPHGREDLCLRVAAALERTAPWQDSYADARRALDAVSVAP